MKKVYLIIALIIILLPEIVLAAPNATISTNVSTIEKGKSVISTLTLTDTAAWNVKIVGSGAATCSTKNADVTINAKSITKDITLECKATEEGTIKFTVTGDITSGSGQTKDISLTKYVTVIKPKSSDNILKDLKIDGVTITGFVGTKNSYTINDFSGTSINITAVPNDLKSSVSGTGNKSLNIGKNTFNIVVTAENGSKKTYTIIVNKLDSRSSNNDLKLLSVDKGTLNFNKDITSYTLELEHDINEITIFGTPDDNKASVSGIGTKVLKDYNNDFSIVVTAENGSTKTYIIKVLRKDINGSYRQLHTDNSVKEMNIKGYDFLFNNDVKKYNVLVDENVDKIEIEVIPNDAYATVSIQNNENLKIGLNNVLVLITAEDGSVNEYTFNVYRLGEEITGTLHENDVKKNQSINIWMIFAGIELLVIIFLMFLLFFKKKKNNKVDIINNQETNIFKIN